MGGPVITADGSLTLHSARYDQTYHSVHGAFTESLHVYLEGGGVLDAMRQRENQPKPAPIQVLEVGLGLGVNALLTAEKAQHYRVPVEYVGIEHDFQAVEVIRKVLAPFPEDPVIEFCHAIESTRITPITSVRLNSHFQLTIVSMALQTALETVLHEDLARFDSVYLDAFSPDSNPECWTADILAKLSKTLADSGRLTTYCAKGSVRRALQDAGMSVTRRPGPPGKRECLVASS